jgi:hypothetical protein
VIGRFVSADSVVPDWFDPQAFNRFAYAKNNPLKYLDPDGHKSVLFGGYNRISTHFLDDYRPIDHDGMYFDRDTGTVVDESGLGEGIDLTTAAAIASGGFVVVGKAVEKRISNSIAKKIANKAAQETAEAAALKITAAEIRATNISKGIPANQLGPSGKPKINVVKHSSLKKAKDAARATADKGGTTVKHPSPKKGNGHLHGQRQDGTKVRTHDEYPK